MESVVDGGDEKLVDWSECVDIEAVEATSVVFASDVADTSLLVVVCCDWRGLVEGAGAAGGTGKRFAIWVVGEDGFEEVDWVVDVRCVWVEALEFRLHFGECTGSF